MRKKNRKQKEKKRRNSKYAGFNISAIDAHKRDGSRLSPPLTSIQGRTASSWMDDHMPEMLWAVLLTGALERAEYLQLFRETATVCREWFKEGGPLAGHQEPTENSHGINFKFIADHTILAAASDQQFKDFLSILLAHPLARDALRPLLLIDSLPSLSRWRDVLDVEPTDGDWEDLSQSISGVLDHQSQQSTDIRWIKVVLPVISGRMHYPESSRDFLECLRLYPDLGDMRTVRPRIRAAEMVVRRNPVADWVQLFWAQAFAQTPCSDPSDSCNVIDGIVVDTFNVRGVRLEIIRNFYHHVDSVRTDPKLDSAFGIVLYALSITEEAVSKRALHGIMGRLALRALVELNITLSYLAKCDSKDLWSSYRVYGAGQAKLAFLKAQEQEGDLPKFMDEDALYAIANEDVWQEFLHIDVGHWAKSNLRQLAIDSDSKDLYDRYYDWTSTFAHGHWGAVRDTNFVTCHNPIHRLHRIPRLLHRSLTSVESDLVQLIDRLLEILDRLFAPRAGVIRLTSATGSVP